MDYAQCVSLVRLKPYIGLAITNILCEQQPKVLQKVGVFESEQISIHRWKHGLGKLQLQFLTKFLNRNMHELVRLNQDFFFECPQLLANYLDAMRITPT